MTSSLLLLTALTLLCGDVQGAVPTAVTDMTSLVAGLQKGATFRYQVKDISKCDLDLHNGQPGTKVTRITSVTRDGEVWLDKSVLWDVAWEMTSALVNVSTTGQRSVQVTDEREVNGSRSGLDIPVLRSGHQTIKLNYLLTANTFHEIVYFFIWKICKCFINCTQISKRYFKKRQFFKWDF